MSRELLVIFSSLGVLNGFFLIIYFLFIDKEDRKVKQLLGLLFLVITVRIGKSVLFYFTELNVQFIHIGLVASSMIGPFLFLYLAEHFRSKWFISRLKYFHLLPSLTLLIFSFFYGYRDYHSLWIQIIYYIRVIWLIYIILSAYLIFTNKEEKSWIENRFWLTSVFMSIFIVWLAYWTSNFTSYIVGALSFSVLIYFLILVIFMRLRPAKKKVKKAKDFSESSDPFYVKLNQKIIDDKVYTNPDITMPSVAKMLQVSPHYLSEFLNEELETNFPKFINHYRIKEAITLLKSSPNLSMETIAFDCGFNSTSTFYSAFKSVTNMTPAKYKESL